MNTHTLACAEVGIAARLRIHAGGAEGRAGWSIGLLLQNLLAQLQDRSQPRLRLEISDLQGHEVLALDNAGPRVEAALQPGTYRITAHVGSVQRGYTVTLAAGAAFDLVLRLTPP